MGSANERWCYIWNVVSHWLSPYSERSLIKPWTLMFRKKKILEMHPCPSLRKILHLPAAFQCWEMTTNTNISSHFIKKKNKLVEGGYTHDPSVTWDTEGDCYSDLSVWWAQGPPSLTWPDLANFKVIVHTPVDIQSWYTVHRADMHRPFHSLCAQPLWEKFYLQSQGCARGCLSVCAENGGNSLQSQVHCSLLRMHWTYRYPQYRFRQTNHISSNTSQSQVMFHTSLTDL